MEHHRHRGTGGQLCSTLEESGHDGSARGAGKDAFGACQTTCADDRLEVRNTRDERRLKTLGQFRDYTSAVAGKEAGTARAAVED